MMLTYLIWNGSPEIFSIGSFTLRWYGLLFALGFLISQQLLYYMYKQEGKPEKDVDTLTIYMVIATIIGARLGHIIFYQPEMIWTDPLGIFLPFEFTPTFRFTGLQGLASHGGAIGILFALWLYSRKKKPGQNYIQVLDRIVILVCITGCLIRLGNFFNSEIIGKPTDSSVGVVFIGRVTEALTNDSSSPVDFVKVIKDEDAANGRNGRVPISIYLFFKPGTARATVDSYLAYEVKLYLNRLNEFVDNKDRGPSQFRVIEETPGTFVARVSTFGIARHPAQLYESISCLLLFGVLFWYWSLRKGETPSGRIFGIFMIVLWTLRFLYEFLKENQVPFEDRLALNMGQILSIPMVLIGIGILVWSFRNSPPKSAGS